MSLVLNEVRLQRPTMELCYTLHVPKGQCMAIMGFRGSGKSSLLHLIAGFETPQSGTIYFDHLSLKPLDPGERPLTILFQQYNLFDHLTIWENVALGLRGTLQLSQEEKSIVKRALSAVGLNNLEKKMPAELSGGAQQKAALARCLLQRKPLLLLDEPFNSLDFHSRLEMLDLLKNLHKNLKLTTLIVTHHPEEALHVASCAAFIHKGKVLAVGPPQELLHQSHPDIEAFRKAYPVLNKGFQKVSPAAQKASSS